MLTQTQDILLRTLDFPRGKQRDVISLPGGAVGIIGVFSDDEVEKIKKIAKEYEELDVLMETDEHTKILFPAIAVDIILGWSKIPGF